ncbi:MAG: hypothetical protein PHI52_09135, partial [Bacteroidales bacterium]|nr:hypothetical protein [Bacteroidales bacterium]
MNQPYKVINLQYAVPPTRPTWGGQGGVGRYYAAWICRFVSVDPLQFKYPELTPFQYASNRCITGIDMDGLEYISASDAGINPNNISLNTHLNLGDYRIEIRDIIDYNGEIYYDIGLNMFYGEKGWSKNGTENEKVSTNSYASILFPLSQKPINSMLESCEIYNWAAKDGKNQATFNSLRQHGLRKHAGIDLYTDDKQDVVALTFGKVLDITKGFRN